MNLSPEISSSLRHAASVIQSAYAQAYWLPTNQRRDKAARNDRGRDAHYCAPPAQIRTGPIRACGSHLGCVTALRYILATCRMRSSACDTVPRLCVRPVLCLLYTSDAADE